MGINYLKKSKIKIKTNLKKKKTIKKNKIKLGGFKPIPKKIWFYWDKGVDNIPYVYQMCIKSYRLLNPEWEIIIIDDKNAIKYLNKKAHRLIYSKKKIRQSHKSDLIRINLINKYGGFWADITTICTKCLNDLINYDFVFHSYGNEKKNLLKISSWSFGAIPKHPFLSKFLINYNNYWKIRDYSDEYFNFHRIFEETGIRFPIITRGNYKILDANKAHIIQKLDLTNNTKEFKDYVDNQLNSMYIYKLLGTSQGIMELKEDNNLKYLLQKLNVLK